MSVVVTYRLPDIQQQELELTVKMPVHAWLQVARQLRLTKMNLPSGDPAGAAMEGLSRAVTNSMQDFEQRCQQTFTTNGWWAESKDPG